MDISSIQSLSSIGGTRASETASTVTNSASIAANPTANVAGFSDVMQSFLHRTNGVQVVAENAIQDFATGKNDNVQHVVLAMANADMAFKFFLEIRNKVVDSYNELMRMQF